MLKTFLQNLSEQLNYKRNLRKDNMHTFIDLEIDNNINDIMKVVFKNCISIDVETTGLDPVKNGILSIGVALFKNNKEFYAENYLRDDAEIDNEALAVNGVSRDKLKAWGDVTELEALDLLVEFAEINQAKVIVGKNPRFDYNFLLEIWKRNGRAERSFPFSYRLIDLTGSIVYLYLKNEIPIPAMGISSKETSNFLEVMEEPKPHNALTGAKMNKLYAYAAIEKIQENTLDNK